MNPNDKGWLQMASYTPIGDADPFIRAYLQRDDVAFDAELARLRAAVAERDAWIAGAAPILRHHEWAGNISNGRPRYCLWCQRDRSFGHAADCDYQRVLSSIPQPLTPAPPASPEAKP